MKCMNSSFCSAVKAILIIYEILDKVVDIAITLEYSKRGLFSHPVESVYRALLYSTITGFCISVVRIPLYLWRIHLNRRNGQNHEKLYNDLDLGVNSLKVLLEAFPQSVIAKFYFTRCPLQENSWGVKILDPTFDIFCGASFVHFCASLSWYVYNYRCEAEPATEHGKRCFLFIFIPIPFFISLVGLDFAILSFSEFAKRCV